MKSEGHYVKGYKTKPQKKFYKNGNLKRIHNSLDGFGLYQEFYKNGNVKRESIYKANNTKTENKYYENGQLMEAMNYKKRLKDGVSKFYDKNSKLAKEQIWEANVLVDEMLHEVDNKNKGI